LYERKPYETQTPETKPPVCRANRKGGRRGVRGRKGILRKHKRKETEIKGEEKNKTGIGATGGGQKRGKDEFCLLVALSGKSSGKGRRSNRCKKKGSGRKSK